MTPKPRRQLDSLELELIERALNAARVALEREGSVVDPDSDEALEAALRRELIEIACENDVSDPEILRKRLFATPVE